MYVNPFWFGVLITLMTEMVALVGASIVIVKRGKKK